MERLAVALCCTAAAQHSMDQQLGHQPSTMLGFPDSSWSSPARLELAILVTVVDHHQALHQSLRNPSSVLRIDPSGLTRAMFVQQPGQAFALLPHAPTSALGLRQLQHLVTLRASFTLARHTCANYEAGQMEPTVRVRSHLSSPKRSFPLACPLLVARHSPHSTARRTPSNHTSACRFQSNHPTLVGKSVTPSSPGPGEPEWLCFVLLQHGTTACFDPVRGPWAS